MITKFNFTDHSIKSYAIRKLTPKECFRLMGVRDDVIAVMQSTVEEASERVCDWPGKGKPEDMAISASQQYKQAGNSIVVDVLQGIFENLFYPPKQKVIDTKYGTLRVEEDGQLSMFHDLVGSQPINRKIRVVTLCSGYDSQCMALDELKRRHPDFDYELVAWSEIDKYACQMHDLVYPRYADRNLGDMTKIDWRPIKDKYGEIDLLTYSTPCQSISQAGLQRGFEKGSGTRSSILWSTEDAIRVLRPRYLLQENVKAIITGYPDFFRKGKDGKPTETFWSHLCKWMELVKGCGYVNAWKIINAKDMGVPQNRERFFLLSQREDVAREYQWPQPVPLEHRLEDVLEEEVPERYFLKDDAVEKFLKANDTDKALFMQFDIPPTHEAAMFLKTWLQMWMKAANGWDMTATSLQLALYSAKQKMELSYSVFCKKGAEALGKEFCDLFTENMKRRPKDAHE